MLRRNLIKLLASAPLLGSLLPPKTDGWAHSMNYTPPARSQNPDEWERKLWDLCMKEIRWPYMGCEDGVWSIVVQYRITWCGENDLMFSRHKSKSEACRIMYLQLSEYFRNRNKAIEAISERRRDELPKTQKG